MGPEEKKTLLVYFFSSFLISHNFKRWVSIQLGLIMLNTSWMEKLIHNLWVGWVEIFL
jgi:general stress protein CsbA